MVSNFSRSALFERLQLERLERRILLAVDFGDAPDPYPTLLADDGPRHEELGLTLVYVLETHTHADHVTAAERLRHRLGAQTVVSEDSGVECADIFVSDGHNGQAVNPPVGSTGRILKFDSEGNFIKQWGEIGFRPGQFRTPHAMAFDSQGRLYVADRGNHRIQIFDQDGNAALNDNGNPLIYMNYSRISGLFKT